ncbi:MAG: hypothetical protein BWY74_00777 [Firmicutes bacterium ADurb.Bin419]|nr:MAG: hypothetical protein BWY74_00777 [Firmicutes bacterium ADurb.Bin419]
MRTKKEVEAEFNQVKVQLEQTQQSVVNLTNRLAELKGQFQILDEIEREKEKPKEKKK